MPVICPIALKKGCAKCQIYNICPLKKIIGDEGRLRHGKNGDVKISPTRPK
ncbi:MAG: hypothetical protein PHV75_02455 [Victivallaceae bacterium]|jgi:hypothetical protein|nr:hypothetical protein [Victivallaceae bacterium]NLK83682.1 hypothetical protein [Lentisphaerota bacterium]MDD3117480.1 hypothetical protein [Victivallaceae bacterium]MDD3704171.1 hypothetical protein [Victivallaceae bacterium]MDD4317362.1 hypothetical protein [Victivallaceae bacterium]